MCVCVYECVVSYFSLAFVWCPSCTHYISITLIQIPVIHALDSPAAGACEPNWAPNGLSQVWDVFPHIVSGGLLLQTATNYQGWLHTDYLECCFSQKKTFLMGFGISVPYSQEISSFTSWKNWIWDIGRDIFSFWLNQGSGQRRAGLWGTENSGLKQRFHIVWCSVE